MNQVATVSTAIRSDATRLLSPAIARDVARFVRLNNEGIAFLQNGNSHLAALRCFRAAMDIIRADVEGAPMDTEDMMKSQSNDINLANVVKSVSIPMSCPTSGKLDDDFLMSVSPHNNFCFYSRAFYLDPTCLDQLARCRTCDMAIVFLFNMAITCQLYGFLHGSPYLKKAACLYRLIASLADVQAHRTHEAHYGYTDVQGRHGNVHDIIGNDPINVILLAVTCNLGHIYSHFFLEIEAMGCHLRLIQLMNQKKMRQPPSSMNFIVSTSENDLTLSEDEIKVFTLNAFFISYSTRHFAPSA